MNIQKWLKWNKGWCQNWSHLHLKAAGEPTALTIQWTVEFHHLGDQKVYSKWRWSVILMITLQTCHKKMSPFFRRLFHPLPSCQRTGRGHNTNESEYQDIYFKPVKTFSVRMWKSSHNQYILILQAKSCSHIFEHLTHKHVGLLFGLKQLLALHWVHLQMFFSCQTHKFVWHVLNIEGILIMKYYPHSIWTVKVKDISTL